MPANTSPIFARKPNIGQGGAILGPTAITAQDGTGSLPKIFDADATNGSFVRKVVLKPAGSPAGTVCRIFLCSDTGTYTPGTTNTAANTTMIAEVALAAVTSSNSAAQNDVVIPIMEAIPAGFKLLISFGTSTGAAGTGYGVTVFAGDY